MVYFWSFVVRLVLCAAVWVGVSYLAKADPLDDALAACQKHTVSGPLLKSDATHTYYESDYLVMCRKVEAGIKNRTDAANLAAANAAKASNDPDFAAVKAYTDTLK